MLQVHVLFSLKDKATGPFTKLLELPHSEIFHRIEETNARTERMQEKRNFESLQRETVLKEALIEKARVQDELRTMKARTHLWGSQRDGMKRLACKCQVLPPPPESEEKEKEAK